VLVSGAVPIGMVRLPSASKLPSKVYVPGPPFGATIPLARSPATNTSSTRK
jgi:hypothetical protein